MADYKQLDPYSEEYKKATLEMLIDDAVARKDKNALKWLQAESSKRDDRVRNGVKIKVDKNIAAIRVDYAKKFLNYKPKAKMNAEALRKRKQEKKEQQRKELFERAFEALGE